MAPSRVALTASLTAATRRQTLQACRGALPTRHYHSHHHPPPPGPFNSTERTILDAAYAHVPEHGFSQQALTRGARDAGYLDISTNLLPDGPFSLIKYHLVTKREALAPRRAAILGAPLARDHGSPDAAAQPPILSVPERVERLTWERLLLNQQVIHRWQEVCGVQFHLACPPLLATSSPPFLPTPCSSQMAVWRRCVHPPCTKGNSKRIAVGTWPAPAPFTPIQGIIPGACKCMSLG